MEITAKIREKLRRRFKGVNYREIVADRAKCHPNTVSNVLLRGHRNSTVAHELIKLGKELKEQEESALAFAKQL